MKIAQAMEIGDHVRQGDLLIIKTGEANSKNRYKPQDLIPDGILALGETTGHAHAVVATLEELTVPSVFLEMKVLEGSPVVLKSKSSHDISFWEIFSRSTNSTEDDNIIAMIHSPVPFWVVHYNKKIAGVIPLDSRGIIGADKLHEPIQLPPGFYEVVQQREAKYTDTGTVKIQRVID